MDSRRRNATGSRNACPVSAAENQQRVVGADLVFGHPKAAQRRESVRGKRFGHTELTMLVNGSLSMHRRVLPRLLKMARISLNPPPTLSFRIANWFMRRKFGTDLDPFRAMGHNMKVAMAYGKLEQSVVKWRSLDVKLQNLADFATVTKIGCPWCLDFGYWIMHTQGVARDKIEAVPKWRTSKLFSPLERLVMEYAEAMTETPPTVSDELVNKLREHLDEGQLVELTMVVCVENVRSRFNSALGIAGQGFKDRCEIPQRSAGPSRVGKVA